MELTLPVELTRSRSGLHARRSAIVIIGRGRREVVSKPTMPGKGTYSKGEAGLAKVTLSRGEVAVHVVLTMGPRKRVKGFMVVYDDNGEEKLKVKYERLKIRFSRGYPDYSWAIDQALDALGLSPYVRRKNYGRRSGAVKEG
ncbi:MAG: hypothetical protein ACP5FT_02770 [Acidilobus sp.]